MGIGDPGSGRAKNPIQQIDQIKHNKDMTQNWPRVTVFIAFVAVVIGSLFVLIPQGATLPFIPDDSPTKFLPAWFDFSIRIFLHDLFEAGVRATDTPRDHVMELATSYYKSEVVFMLAHYNIFDVIDANSTTCHEVATLLELQAHVVCEFLKAANQLGLFTVDRHGFFSLSASGKLLRSGKGLSSLRDVALFINDESRLAWRATVIQSAQTGESGWNEAFGLGAVQWFESNPEKQPLMNQFRLSIIEEEAGAILGDWTPPNENGVFCDIGGGRGETLIYLLRHYTQMTGIVVDKAYLGLSAMQLIQEHKLTNRAKFVGGFFFAPTLPKLLIDCDVLLLKHVLNELNDEDSIMVLKKVKAVAKPGARVVIAERMLGTSMFEVSKSLASVNLVATSDYGAKDRTLQEYNALVSAAGYLKPFKLVRLRNPLTILEVSA